MQTLCEAQAKIRRGAEGPKHTIILLTKYLLLSPTVRTLGGGPKAPTLCEAQAKIRRGAEGPEHNILLTKYLLLSPTVRTLGGGRRPPPRAKHGQAEGLLLIVQWTMFAYINIFVSIGQPHHSQATSHII